MSVNLENPINDFSGCHKGMLAEFAKLKALPQQLQQADTAEAARNTAEALRRFFINVVKPHHDDEEFELFHVVRESLKKHPESAMLAVGYIGMLVEEHRHLEKSWARIDKTLKQIANGKPTELDLDKLTQFAADYIAHAEFEETYFLPLADKLLSQGDKAKLGMSLHIRHQYVQAKA